jgi:cytochrome P450
MNAISGLMAIEPRERAPATDYDPFALDALLEPYAGYTMLQDTGPAVWLNKANAWAVSRYKDARYVLKSADLFLSGFGTGLNDQSNAILIGTTQSSDGDLHRRFRRTVQTPLMPSPLKELRPSFEEAAREVVSQLPDGVPFEAVHGLAQALPLSIVSNLVGLPEEGREKMLPWGAAAFEVMGPPGERQQAALGPLQELVAYAMSVDDPEKLKPGSWGQSLYTWAQKTGIPRDKILSMILDYSVPSLDTTISATATLLYYLGNNPDQWQLLRSNPSLIPRAIDEAIRLESPIRCFSRVAAEDTVIEDVEVKAGERVLVLYGAANRDPRQWANADRFDVTRANQGQLGFGHGEHQCVGMPLARMEITAILEAMIDQIETIEVVGHRFAQNQLLRGLDLLNLVVTRRSAAG